MDGDTGGTISEEELVEVLRLLAREGELDYLLEEQEQDAAAVAEFFERGGDNLADIRVAHAARRAVGLVRDMVGVVSDQSAVDLVDKAAATIEVGIDHAYALLSGSLAI